MRSSLLFTASDNTGVSRVMPAGHVIFQVLAGVVFLVLVFKIIYWVFIYPYYISPLRRLPGPKNNHWLLGQGKSLLRASWVPFMFQNWSESAPDAPFIRYLSVANQETLVANNISSYKEILQTKNSSFVKPTTSRKTAVPVIGDGLPFAEGHVHRLRRGVLNKLFSTAEIRSRVPLLRSKATRLAHVLECESRATGEVEVETHIWKTVLDVIGLETLGFDLNHLESSESQFHSLFSQTMQQSLFSHIIHYLSAFIPLRRLIPFKVNRDFVNCCADIRRRLLSIITDRYDAHKSGIKVSDTTDVIQTMLEQQSLWTKEEMVEYVLNFLVLGHDTTACSLVWAIHELARNPAVQRQLRQEIAGLQSSLSDPSHADIEKLGYLDNFLREVLRIYCPVAYVPREAIEDVEIAGVMLPKGTVVQLCPAVINLSPKIWGPDAKVFNPNRWNNLQGEASSAYALQTFHNGPRICIGRQFAMTEMKVILIELVGRFKFEAVGDSHEVMEYASPSFTLRPRERLRVSLADV